MGWCLIRVVLATAFSLLFCGGAHAREWLAVGTHFPQLYERAADGSFTGLAPTVLRELAGELGVQVRFELHPWARAQYMVELGQADILVGPYRTAEREGRFSFAAEPFYQDHLVFFAQRDREALWRGDYAALRGRRLAVVRGWTYGLRFEAARGYLQPITVESVSNGLRMLAAGRIDLLASNARNTQPPLRELGLQGRIVELAPLIDVQRGYFAFPRDAEHQRLRHDIDRAFANFVESGRLARLTGQLGVGAP